MPNPLTDDTYGPNGPMNQDLAERTARAQALSDLVNSGLMQPVPNVLMQPDLLEAGLGLQPKAGTWVDELGRVYDKAINQPIQETRRPNVLPVTRTPEGNLEFAMPRALDIIGNVAGGAIAPVKAAKGDAIMGAGPIRKLTPVDHNPFADDPQRLIRAQEQGFDINNPVYHGTNQDFKSFNLKNLGKNTNTDSSKLGIYFTESPKEAGDYANMAARHMFADEKQFEKTVKNLQSQIEKAERSRNFDLSEKLTLDLENLYSGAMQDDTGQQIVKTFLKKGKVFEIDATGKNLADVTPMIEKAKAEGYDSVNLKNMFDPVSTHSGNEATNQWIVFNPKNIRSVNAKFDPAKKNSAMLLAADAPVGLVAGGVRDAYKRTLSPLGLYSHGAETAAGLQQAKGTPDQMTAILRRSGVKPDELYNAGIADETATNVMRSKIESKYAPKLAAAKLEMDALGLNENTINKKSPDYNKALEIRQSPETKAKYQYDSALNAMRSEMDSAMVLHPDWASRPSVTREELAKHFNERMPQVEEKVSGITDKTFAKDYDSIYDRFVEAKQRSPENDGELRNWASKHSDTKFQQYTLPGSENYREVLLKMPQSSEYVVRNKSDQILSRHPDRASALAEMQKQKVNDPYVNIDKASDIEGFKSQHWDDPNVLAHLRMADRTGPNGEKILHVEEIQSDWAQKGRKEGFDTPEIRAKMLKELPEGYVVENAPSQGTGFPDRYFVRNEQGQLVGTGYTRESAINSTINELNDQVRGTTASLVPEGPYVTSTQGWTDLALKRALKEAADGNYDRMVWTPGAEQAKRYSLSNQVRSIDYMKEGDNSYRLGIVDKRGEGIDLPKETFTAKELEDYLGRDVANKIINDEGQSYRGRNHKSLEGVDLVLGGEGMKSYYDKIVPTRLKEVVKRIDPEAKIEMTKIKGKDGELEVPSIKMTPKLKEAIKKGLPAFSIGGAAALGVANSPNMRYNLKPVDHNPFEPQL